MATPARYQIAQLILDVVEGPPSGSPRAKIADLQRQLCDVSGRLQIALGYMTFADLHPSTAADLRAAVQEASGKSMRAFYDTWIEAIGAWHDRHPDVEVPTVIRGSLGNEIAALNEAARASLDDPSAEA